MAASSSSIQQAPDPGTCHVIWDAFETVQEIRIPNGSNMATVIPKSSPALILSVGSGAGDPATNTANVVKALFFNGRTGTFFGSSSANSGGADSANSATGDASAQLILDMKNSIFTIKEPSRYFRKKIGLFCDKVNGAALCVNLESIQRLCQSPKMFPDRNALSKAVGTAGSAADLSFFDAALNKSVKRSTVTMWKFDVFEDHQGKCETENLAITRIPAGY